MKTATKLARALGLLLVLSTAAFAALSTTQVTTRIRNKINSKWKTTGLNICVVPYQDAQATARGRYKSVSVSATDVTVSNVKMTGVKLSAADVTLDLDQLVRRNEIVTVKRKAGHLQAKVSEADLNKALAYSPKARRADKLLAWAARPRTRTTLTLGAPKGRQNPSLPSLLRPVL